MATGVLYNNFKKNSFSPLVDFANDTLKVALLANTYTPDIDTHDFFNDVVAHELSTAHGYTAGGATIAGKSVTVDTANNKVVFDCTDPSWTIDATGITCRYAVLYKSTGDNATSPLIAVWDFGGDQNPVDIAFTLIIASTGAIDAA